MSLFPYKQAFFDTVEAVSMSLNVEVAIFDIDYRLFVSSPKYVKRKGKATHIPSLMEAMETERSIVYQPGEMEICNGCRFKHNCPSTIEILKSIRPESGVAGVISIISFTQEGKKRIIQNLQVYMNAIDHISALLANIIAYSGRPPKLPAAQQPEAAGTESFIHQIKGESPAVIELKNDIEKVAASSSTVLIMAESGTGKELVARAIHDCSPRRKNPFVAVNCASITESIFESEFFGYESGAFTDARKSGKMGFFELADTGTLFLDEISEMSYKFQAKLLRVLQENTIYRVGGTKPIHCDVRIVSATNRNLKEMVAKKEFRQDLYYRLHVIPMVVRPLRERREDIGLLSHWFLEKYNRILGRSLIGISPEVLELFQCYSWPGNIRELENMMEYLINMEESPIIEKHTLPNDFVAEAAAESGTDVIRNLERQAIRDYLEKYGWDTKGKKEAADRLGIGVRTLYRKISEYSLDRDLA